jgi:hypothetical protein
MYVDVQNPTFIVVSSRGIEVREKTGYVRQRTDLENKTAYNGHTSWAI